MDGLHERAKNTELGEILECGAEQNLSERDLLEAAESIEPSTLDWLRTARNLVKSGGTSGAYEDVEKCLRTTKPYRRNDRPAGGANGQGDERSGSPPPVDASPRLDPPSTQRHTPIDQWYRSRSEHRDSAPSAHSVGRSRTAGSSADTEERHGSASHEGTTWENEMILELALLNVRPGTGDAFERAFAQAQSIVSSMPGYVSHQLQRCLETTEKYVLLVEWENVEDHTVGFRDSAQYQEWKRLLHHFYEPFPTVEHYEPVFLGGAQPASPPDAIASPRRTRNT